MEERKFEQKFPNGFKKTKFRFSRNSSLHLLLYNTIIRLRNKISSKLGKKLSICQVSNDTRKLTATIFQNLLYIYRKYLPYYNSNFMKNFIKFERELL